MAVADKTYSFRAPSEFSERMREARASLPRIFSSGDTTNHFTREFPVAVQRSLLGSPDTPGLTIRAIVEAFVSTVERVQREP